MILASRFLRWCRPRTLLLILCTVLMSIVLIAWVCSYYVKFRFEWQSRAVEGEFERKRHLGIYSATGVITLRDTRLSWKRPAKELVDAIHHQNLRELRQRLEKQGVPPQQQSEALSVQQQIGDPIDRLLHRPYFELGPVSGPQFDWMGVHFELLTQPSSTDFHPDNRLVHVAAPYWYLAVLTAIVPASRTARWCRRRRAAKSSTCRQCGYDLRATPDRCPECGRESESTKGKGKRKSGIRKKNGIRKEKRDKGLTINN